MWKLEGLMCSCCCVSPVYHFLFSKRGVPLQAAEHEESKHTSGPLCGSPLESGTYPGQGRIQKKLQSGTPAQA